MAFTLPKLPYATSSLKSFISEETFEFHYGKHHKTYIDNMNNLLPGSGFESATLEEIVKKSEGGMFNNSAQSWNHTFYWECMTDKPAPLGDGTALMAAVKKQFGSMDELKKQFIDKAKGNFGSGWTWLVKTEAGGLEIVNTSNAEVPFKKANNIPVLVVDVWEHAYYIGYRNARPKYLEDFWAHVNWTFAGKCFDGTTVPAMGEKMKG